METHAGGKKKIYYDATCRVCSVAADAYAKPENYERFDVTSGQLPPGVTREDAMRYMYVIDSDGKVLRGADAVMRVMDDHWFWKWFSPIGRLPGFHALAVVMYRFVATHRYLLGKREAK